MSDNDDKKQISLEELPVELLSKLPDNEEVKEVKEESPAIDPEDKVPEETRLDRRALFTELEFPENKKETPKEEPKQEPKLELKEAPKLELKEVPKTEIKEAPVEEVIEGSLEETLNEIAKEEKSKQFKLEEVAFDEEVAKEAESEAKTAAMNAADAEREAEELRRKYLESRRKRNRRVEKKKTIAEEVLDWLKTICIGIIAGVLLVIFVIQRDDVYGRSMMPTLSSGDVVFTQKISTYFDTYDRGDVVILDGKGMYGYDKEEYLIKRVIGLPGETVKIEDGNVYIKPKGSSEFYMLNETYLEPGTQTTVRSYGVEHGYDEVVLGEKEYYCMGDNRPESNDSRTLGVFTANRIKGVAVIRIFPFNSIKLL